MVVQFKFAEGTEFRLGQDSKGFGAKASGEGGNSRYLNLSDQFIKIYYTILIKNRRIMKMKSDCQSKDPQSNNPSKVKLNSSTSSDVNLSQKFISFSKGLREKSVGSQLARKDSDLLLQQKIQLQKTENGFIIDVLVA